MEVYALIGKDRTGYFPMFFFNQEELLGRMRDLHDNHVEIIYRTDGDISFLQDRIERLTKGLKEGRTIEELLKEEQGLME